MTRLGPGWLLELGLAPGLAAALNDAWERNAASKRKRSLKAMVRRRLARRIAAAMLAGGVA